MLTSISFSSAMIHLTLVKGFSPLEYCDVRESTFCMVTMPEIVYLKRGSFVLALGFRCFSHGSLALLFWVASHVAGAWHKRPSHLVKCKTERSTS